eukprot:TRINITY_DN3881_c0_g1_i2.p1 TRINITY_DN3881_c0_g1~~TRINITY_DN3881_c0_g1_i2.p1  ORF type:complete len:1192 (+),score=258.09 TRINITY_DN3881_c0_g1_i2:235-3810(+)
MRTVVAWADKVQERDGAKQSIYDMAFRPDGSQLVVAAGNRVLIYEGSDGDLLQSLKGHKDTVYCVSYSKDGKRFASGGADKTVIIWTNKLEGILKYSHNDSIQCLAYNPVTAQLASCTATDFGLWSPEQKSVAKHKVSSRILSCSWTNDGQFIALGLYNGNVSIRDKNGDERVKIERNAPVWCLSWNPSRDEPYDLLAVGDWDQKLAFFQLNGRQVGKDRELGFDPCSIGYFTNGEYLCIGGSDRKVSLWTKEGVKLTHIGERDDWVWCCHPKPKQNYVGVGCNDGSLAVYQLIFSTVHGLYQDRYAYRDFMTDVIVQHLLTEQKLRIKCRDYVKKIAIYKDRLAVQMPDKVVIYELFHDDAGELHYRVREKIAKKMDCNLLVVTSNHIILCQEKTLQLFDFQGTREREWSLEAQIRYIKVIGGQPNREGLLVGLKNGQILKVFINNPFPIQLVKQNTSVRCLDLSASRQKLAVVDELNMCIVYDLKTKELLFQEPNANSVAWNTDHEDMLCFSGNGMLNIKASTFPIHSQKLQGFVVGFKGSKIFCLHIYAMQSIDVPQSATLYRYLEKKDFLNAYRVACLGVTDDDWQLLAMEALQNMTLDIARKSFIRIKEIRYLELIARIELMRSQSKFDDSYFLGEVMAYQGKYHEAAKLFVKAGHAAKAVEMFSDLKMYDQAKLYATDSGDATVKDLIKKQANWSEEVGDVKSASDMYIAAGEHLTAIKMLGEKGSVNELQEIARKLPHTESEALQLCASHLMRLKETEAAKEIYERVGDKESLLKLHVQAEKWEEAQVIAKENPELSSEIFLPYAQWLAVNDRFEESEDAFLRAGKPEEAAKVLEQLTFNAVTEERFDDAAHYYWKLSIEELNMVKNRISDLTKDDEKHVKRFRELQSKADIYYAYHHIHRFVGDPFTTTAPMSLFNMARFLLTKVAKNCPIGVSKANILYTLAKMSKQLGAFKLARTAYDRLQTMRLPSNWIDEVDTTSVSIRSKPFTDREDLLPVCHRCSNSNPLLNNQGDVCVGCQQEFIRSFNSFEHLPLVEFILPDDLPDEQAAKLLDSQLYVDSNRGGNSGGGWKETKQQKIQTLSFNTPEAEASSDPFTRLLSETLDASEPIRVNESILRSMQRNEVFIKKWPTPALKTQYFKSMIPEAPIVMCHGCNRFYDEEEYELVILQKGFCPFCHQVSTRKL